MSSAIYKITCLTNLSVGNGESNFSVIDNEVEKDAVNGLPIINASGLKGAFREYFTKNNIDRETVKKLFGSDVKDTVHNATHSTPGNLKFLDAQTIALPCRASKGKKAYYMVVPSKALDSANETFLACGNNKLFDNIPNANENHTDETEVEIEGIRTEKSSCDISLSLFGLRDYVILDDSSISKIGLPVLARNQLENGLSKNLWYEEVVPHKTIMYFAVLGDESSLNVFFDSVNGKVVQFGGNASIGRGLCLVEKVK